MTGFPEGFTIRLGTQDYRPVSIATDLRVASRKYIQWQTECPDCGKSITVSTSLVFDKPSRRCSDCKAPGRPVQKKVSA
jgi:hypothetical protein